MINLVRLTSCALLMVLLLGCAHHQEPKLFNSLKDKKTKSWVPFSGDKEITPDANNALLNFFDAHFYEMRDMDKAAIDAMRKAVAADTQSAFLHQELARYMGEANQLTEGYEHALAAVNIEPKNPFYQILLGKVESLKGNSHQAIAHFTKALQLNAKEEEAYKLIVREHLLAKNFQQAILYCKKWIVANPRSKLAFYTMGSLYSVQLKNPKAGFNAFKKVLEFDPDDVRALASLARLAIDEKIFTEASEYMSRLESLSPSDMDVVLRNGILLFQLKKYVEAELRFQKVLAANPQSDQVLYYLGLTYEVQKKLEDAIKVYNKIPEDSNLFHDSFIRKAVIMYDLNKNEQLINELKSKLGKKDSADYYDILATVYSRIKKYDLAMQTLAKAADLYPRNEKILFSLGVLYEKLNQDDKSLEVMERLVGLNPKHALALNYVGYYYTEKNIKLDVALDYIQRALKLNPDDGYIVDSLGWIYFKMGDLKKAEFYLKKADQMEPNEYTLLDHLGDLYKKLGDTGLAKQYYQRAIKAIESLPTLENRAKQDLEKIREKLK